MDIKKKTEETAAAELFLLTDRRAQLTSQVPAHWRRCSLVAVGLTQL